MSYGLEELLKQRSEIDAELRRHKSPVTVMFTDLAGSTAFFDRYGDTAGVAWIEEHQTLVFPQIEAHAGTVVKTIGDSVMAYFTDPQQGLGCAKAIQQALQRSNEGRPLRDRMNIRVALHQGLGYLRGGDVFGDVVNVAARIAKACLPAQILVSESVYLTAQPLVELEFRPVGAVQFQGKSSKESLYELLWTDEATYAELRQRFPAKVSARPQEESSGGRYQILSEVGHGAMGVAYRAYDRIIGRVVAMKTIPLEVEAPQRPALVERLKQEARTAGILDHPNIVTVYDVGEEAGLFYFTMQFVEGKTLAAFRSEKEMLPVDKVLDVMDQICSAVGFAHQAGVIHRDLKPSNIMLTHQGTVKVLDFGIAKFGDVGLTKAGMILGTPSYLAPEQAAGRRIDHRADIFSLGAVMYELLTCEKAFPGETTTSVIYKIMNEDPVPPRAIEPSLTPAVDGIVRRALAKDPNHRFQSCEEMRQSLQQARQGGMVALMAVASPKPAATVRARTPAPAATAPRRGSSVWLVLVLIVVLGGGAGGWWWYSSRLAKASAPAGKTESAPAQQPAPAIQAPATPVEAVTSPPPPAATGTASAETKAPAASTPEGAKVTAPPETATAQPEAKKIPLNPRKERTRAAAPRPRRTSQEDNQKADSERNRGNEQEAGSSLFTREDVPNLLAKAEAYAGRGEYDKAIFLYQEILRIDPKNGSARDGLNRAREARGLPH
jgi:class 3 adenylate cyclase